MEWFRMYNSMVDSVKVGQLTDSEFRTYVELQCLAADLRDSGRTGVTEGTINWRLRRDCRSDVTVTSHLVTLSLVKIGAGGEVFVADWAERQVYDGSAARTRTWREKKAKVLNGKDAPVGDGHGDGGDVTGDDSEERRREESSTSASNKILFDADLGQFLAINDAHLAVWKKAAPAVNLTTEIHKAEAWLVANPKNRKSNNNRFISNWLVRAQERAARVPGAIAEPKRKYD